MRWLMAMVLWDMGETPAKTGRPNSSAGRKRLHAAPDGASAFLPARQFPFRLHIRVSTAPMEPIQPYPVSSAMIDPHTTDLPSAAAALHSAGGLPDIAAAGMASFV
jgi:hypothetical protein